MNNDLIGRLQATNKRVRHSQELRNEAADEIERLREALQKIVDRTPANQHKEWPHHHFYLVTAKEALKQTEVK